MEGVFILLFSRRKEERNQEEKDSGCVFIFLWEPKERRNQKERFFILVFSAQKRKTEPERKVFHSCLFCTEKKERNKKEKVPAASFERNKGGLSGTK